ncbi:MAG: type II toxin-antitoxin system ParD family antitoxin [Pseudomonadota bacterium]
MPIRQVLLNDQQDALVSALVSSGRYRDAAEVLLAGLRMIAEREACGANDNGAMRPVHSAARVMPDCWITQLHLPTGTT